MRKHAVSTTSPRQSIKRKGSGAVRASQSMTSATVAESQKVKEDYKINVFPSPLPQIPSFSSVSSSRYSPISFPITPPKAHQSSITLTPINPRHPGSASSSDSSRSSLSSSSSFISSTSSSAVRDLSSFIQTQPKALPFYYHHPPTPASIAALDKSSFQPSTYASPVILDHTSHSPYYGQILPPPPSLTLTTLQASRELNYSITTPGKVDKDRYISALALIELSKG